MKVSNLSSLQQPTTPIQQSTQLNVEPQEPMTTWIANPGDVLYLPPNMIHPPADL